jgi:hypothetical protein
MKGICQAGQMGAMMAVSNMSEAEQKRARDARYRDRRVDERFEVNAPGGCINYQGIKYPCQIVDVSLSGCCVRTESLFLHGNLAHVEIVMPILGMVLRLVGKIQWLTRDNLIGIIFFHASSKSKNQLAGLITCLVDQSITEEVKAAVALSVQTKDAYLNIKVPEDWLPNPALTPELKEPPKLEERPAPPPPPRRASKPVQAGEAGSLIVEEGVWPAVLQNLKDNSRMKGAIIGLNKDGCSFRSAKPFTDGSHIRVEVDFHMRGLPFLLAGVTEEVHDKKTVDIRFVELSHRKRAELADLIEEIREEAMKQSS